MSPCGHGLDTKIITCTDLGVNRSDVLPHDKTRDVYVPSDELLRANVGLRKAGSGKWGVGSGGWKDLLNSQWAMGNDQLSTAKIAVPQSLIPSPQSLIKIHPSLATAFLKTETTAYARVWLLARLLDEQGGGHLRIVDLFEKLTAKESPLRVCGKRRLKQILQGGAGVFWTRDDQGRLFLRGMAKLSADLHLTQLSGTPVNIPVSDLLGGIKQVRASLYKVFHAGRKNNNPISRQTLESIMGVSARSMRDYDKLANVDKVQQTALAGAWEKSAVEQASWQHRGVFKFIERQKDGSTRARIAWRLPNQYTTDLSQAGRGGTRKLNQQLQGLVTKRAQDDCEQANGNWNEKTVFCQDASKIGRLVGSTKDVYLKEGKRWLVIHK